MLGGMVSGAGDVRILPSLAKCYLQKIRPRRPGSANLFDTPAPDTIPPAITGKRVARQGWLPGTHLKAASFRPSRTAAPNGPAMSPNPIALRAAVVHGSRITPNRIASRTAAPHGLAVSPNPIASRTALSHGSVISPNPIGSRALRASRSSAASMECCAASPLVVFLPAARRSAPSIDLDFSLRQSGGRRRWDGGVSNNLAKPGGRERRFCKEHFAGVPSEAEGTHIDGKMRASPPSQCRLPPLVPREKPQSRSPIPHPES
jgi:hypothetical protein